MVAVVICLGRSHVGACAGAGMKPMVQPDSWVAEHKKSAIQRCENRWANKVFVFSVLGVLSLVLGFVISVLGPLGLIDGQWSALTGVGLLLAAVACTAVIAHFLDKEGEELRKLREEFNEYDGRSSIYEEWEKYQ